MKKIRIHGMLCFTWQDTLIMEVELVTTGIVFAYSQYWKNTTINRLLIKKNMPYQLQSFISCLNMVIWKAILITLINYLVSKTLKYLECIKTQILLIKINNQPKLWRQFYQYSPEFQQQQVANLLIRLLRKWLNSLQT